MIANLSTKIKPNEDFYTHVNEKWLNETEIPADKAKYGTFNILHDKTEPLIKELLENAYESKNNNFKKLGILYKQGLNNNSNKEDIKHVVFFLNIINNITTTDKLFDEIMNVMLRFNISSPLEVYVSADYDEPKFNILHITSCGLGLPDRDYYTVDTPEHIKIRQKYKLFLKEYCALFKLDYDIDKIYQLEEKLAHKMHTKTEARDIDMINNPMSYQDFEKRYPNLKFVSKVFEVTDNDAGKVNVSNPTYFDTLNTMVMEDLMVWKEYFNLKFILDSHNYLSDIVSDTYFNFYGKVISGQKEQSPKWKRSIKTCEDLIGELIGKLYTDKYFPKATKDKANELVDYIKDALRTILKKNNWMEQSTKDKANEKLDKMHVKIGYPDKLDKNYDCLNINEEYTYFENVLFCKVFLTLDHISYLYQPVNPSKWHMNAHNVNAYYSPTLNDIVFPAGILQEPFFSANQDAAYNFGGIGAVIGHEITHGFDDEGRRFDGDGKLNEWWSKNDIVEYNKRTQIIVNQYSEYSPLNNNNKVNGELTLGENIADIGGIYIALKAYLLYSKNNEPNIKGFFMNYANIWKNKSHEENTLLLLTIDPHSPPIFRVNGALKNIDEFYDAFNITENDRMFISSDKRARIWSDK